MVLEFPDEMEEEIMEKVQKTIKKEEPDAKITKI